MGKKFAVSMLVQVEELGEVPAECGLTLDEIGEVVAAYTNGLSFEEEIGVPAEDGAGTRLMKVEYQIDSVSYGKVVEIVDPSDRVKRPRRRPRPSPATTSPPSYDRAIAG